MSLPYFYMERVAESDTIISLEEDTSKHVAQVLRMEEGEKLQLTDGKGSLFTAEITRVHKKTTEVKILSGIRKESSPIQVTIGISLIKNTSRFEWFLEKATEIGINNIIPLICDRTEKHHYRIDRMKSILISAMLQSQQSWLPGIAKPVPFENIIHDDQYAQKFIAHCEETSKRSIKDFKKENKMIMLIGPEGDFSSKEIEFALQNNFNPVTLGDTRLRTETAGVVAATLLKNL